jgi:1,2-phenylacetyl-CoA epoxidase catalytic subunit
MIQWLIDGAAIMNQKTLADGAYGRYVRTMRRINMEEAFHFKSGEDMVLTLMAGTRKSRRTMTQEAFDRWWGRRSCSSARRTSPMPRSCRR